MKEKEKLARCRKKIDTINSKLCNLLNRRAKIALQIAEIKKTLGLKIHIPGRERDILKALAKLNTGPMSQPALNRIFKTIMKETRGLEKTGARRK